MESNKKTDPPVVTVGIPIFNGEEFLKRRLDGILNQTYQNFEILISDNASTDLTSNICKEYQKLNNKIKYYLQEKNLGYAKNFNYLIKNSRSKYFVLASVDDLWEPTFLEENIKILELNKKVIGSISDVEFFGYDGKPPKSSKLNLKLKKLIRKQDVDVLEKHVMSSKGDYNKKINEYLRFNQGSFIHGVFHTNVIQKNIIPKSESWDLLFILNVLKFGDLHVIDKVLFRKFAKGLSSNGIIAQYKRQETSFFGMFFPMSLYSWCKKNLGLKFLIKNLDWFLVVTIFNVVQVFKEISNKKY
jgi:glycosyltransferase involved in cell wall biosynthesis